MIDNAEKVRRLQFKLFAHCRWYTLGYRCTYGKFCLYQLYVNVYPNGDIDDVVNSSVEVQCMHPERGYA